MHYVPSSIQVLCHSCAIHLSKSWTASLEANFSCSSCLLNEIPGCVFGKCTRIGILCLAKEWRISIPSLHACARHKDSSYSGTFSKYASGFSSDLESRPFFFNAKRAQSKHSPSSTVFSLTCLFKFYETMESVRRQGMDWLWTCSLLIGKLRYI